MTKEERIIERKVRRANRNMIIDGLLSLVIIATLFYLVYAFEVFPFETFIPVGIVYLIAIYRLYTDFERNHRIVEKYSYKEDEE